MSRHHREVARQDVVIGPHGPVEIYRADRAPRRKVKNDCLSTKYKLNRSELNTMRHLTVNGDKISYSNPHRNYIYHRQAFDWYNSRRAIVLDDMEEILPVPGSLSRPHVRSIYDSSQYFKAFSRYATPDNCYTEEPDDESEEECEVPPPVEVKKPTEKVTVHFKENPSRSNASCIDKIIVEDIAKAYRENTKLVSAPNQPQVIYHGGVKPDGTVDGGCKNPDDISEITNSLKNTYITRGGSYQV